MESRKYDMGNGWVLKAFESTYHHRVSLFKPDLLESYPFYEGNSAENALRVFTSVVQGNIREWRGKPIEEITAK